MESYPPAGESSTQSYAAPTEGDVVADDDDAVNVPPPSMDYLAHPEAVLAHRPPPVYAGLEYKRTLIPILLVGAVCLAVIGTSRSFVRLDTKLGSLPDWMIYVIYGSAALSMVFGVLMMLLVASNLKATKTPESPPMP